MPNGRCRCHGGKSTGPRTPEGRAAMTAAHTKHGNTTAPSRIRHRYIRTLIKRTRLACQARLLWPYLPTEMSARLAAGPEELWAPVHPTNLPFLQTPDPSPETTTPTNRRPTQPTTPAHPLPHTLAAERAAARTEAAALAPWRQAIAFARATKRATLAANRTARAAKRAARAQAARNPTHTPHSNTKPPSLPPPNTPWTDYTPLERELAARRASLRARANQPATPAPNPNSTLPRINPMNPEPAATPAPNPDSAFPRINPMNPEPPPRPDPTRPTPTKAQALRGTTLAQTWDPNPYATLAQRFGHARPTPACQIPQTPPTTDPAANAVRAILAEPKPRPTPTTRRQPRC
jgi:hypothetical protein